MKYLFIKKGNYESFSMTGYLNLDFDVEIKMKENPEFDIEEKEIVIFGKMVFTDISDLRIENKVIRFNAREMFFAGKINSI